MGTQGTRRARRPRARSHAAECSRTRPAVPLARIAGTVRVCRVETSGSPAGLPRDSHSTRAGFVRQNMAALREATLNAGKFAWQMMWTGGDAYSIGGTGLAPIVTRANCARALSPCRVRAPARACAGWFSCLGSADAKRRCGLSAPLCDVALLCTMPGYVTQRDGCRGLVWCAAMLRSLCNASSPAQTRAMA
jgi:hypothetical protein